MFRNRLIRWICILFRNRLIKLRWICILFSTYCLNLTLWIPRSLFSDVLNIYFHIYMYRIYLRGLQLKIWSYNMFNPLAVKSNNETTSGWISKVIWGHRAGRQGERRWDYFRYSTIRYSTKGLSKFEKFCEFSKINYSTKGLNKAPSF